MAERLLAYEQNIETPVEILDTLGGLVTGAELADAASAKTEIASVDALLADILGNSQDTVSPHEFVQNFEEKSGE